MIGHAGWPVPTSHRADCPARDAAEQGFARIIEAARTRFLAKGIAGASIEGIAAATEGW
jgi:AcrR family transcriptional regulator